MDDTTTDIVAQEPSTDRTPADNAELSPEQTVEETVSAPKVDPEASRKARQAGEEKRIAVSSLIEAAKNSDSAKEHLFKMFEDMPSMKEYAEKKFGDDLKALHGQNLTTEEAKSVEQLKMEAKAEIFAEKEREEQVELVTSLCEQFGKGKEDAVRIEKLAKVFSKETGDDFQTALIKAARAEWPDHASLLTLPGNSVPVSHEPKIQITAADRKIAAQFGVKPEKVAKDRMQLETYGILSAKS